MLLVVYFNAYHETINNCLRNDRYEITVRFFPMDIHNLLMNINSLYNVGDKTKSVCKNLK